MENELVKYKIKGREVTFYLTTDEDLLEIKSKNIFGDIFTLLFSISIGGIVSIELAFISSPNFIYESLKIFDILSAVFYTSTIITGLLAAYFYWISFKVISKIKRSGEIKSINTPSPFVSSDNSSDAGLEIKSAFYWTPKEYRNITGKVQGSIINNKLFLVVNNALVDDKDPEIGVIKKLTITYKLNGVLFQREYKEGDIVTLP